MEIGYGDCVLWLLRVVLCRKIGDLGFFHCIWVKERGLNVVIMEVDSLLSVVGKIYAGILVVRKVTEGLINDEFQIKEWLCRSDLHPSA